MTTKAIAEDIGQTLSESSPILDNALSKMNRVEGKVKNTTKRVKEVEIASSTKLLWLVILLLIVLLIILVIVAVKTN